VQTDCKMQVPQFTAHCTHVSVASAVELNRVASVTSWTVHGYCLSWVEVSNPVD